MMIRSVLSLTGLLLLVLAGACREPAPRVEARGSGQAASPEAHLNSIGATEERVPTPMKGWEIYTWLEDGAWHWALLPGTNRLRPIPEIQAGGSESTGIEALAAAVARLSEGAHVTWPGPAGRGSSDGGGPLAMPPAAEIGAVLRAAKAAGVNLSVDQPERADPSTPDEAIAELIAGNLRYVKQRNEAHTISVSKDDLAAGQAPFAAILRCADSRVAPEICFDQPLGKLFVCGVAGNIPTPEVIASLEYGVAVLGTKVIVVMGHSACGAVGAALKYQDDTSVLPGSLPMLIDQIVAGCTRGVDPESPGALAEATVCNANMGVDEIMKRSPVIAEAVQHGKLRLMAGVQDLGTGKFAITRN